MTDEEMRETSARVGESMWWRHWVLAWDEIGQACADQVLGSCSHQRHLDAHYIERNGWAPGVWDGEPDRIEWRSRGYVCVAQRAPVTGSWCGYVGVAEGHPWHARHYDELDVEVHGGLTYSALCGEWVSSTPEPGEDPHPWFVGFDCAHFQDRMPEMEATMEDLRRFAPDLPRRPEHPVFYTYRDEAYVMGEVERLVDQAALAAAHVSPLRRTR